MDEGILNELLECSVCLERLDSSSKVLPCQHTFCKRCLEEIYTSRNELRCPECRILVEIGINSLPNNFLLIRLLEGIKNVPRVANKPEENKVNSALTTHGKGATQGIETSKQNRPSHAGNVEKNSKNNVTSQKQVVQPHPCAKALFTYDAKEPGDLSFKKSDIIMLKKRIDQNWYHGELGSKHGFFPASYVKILTPLPTHLPQAKGLYDFSLHEKDCLNFKKGEILTVIRRIDENWIEGKFADKIGIFPITFVEVNSAAKAIIKLSSNSHSGPVRDAPPAPKQHQQPTVSSPTKPSHVTSPSSNSSSQSSSASDRTAGTKASSSTAPNRSDFPQSASTAQFSNSMSTPVIPQPLPQPPSHPKHLIHRQQREKRHSVSASILTPTKQNNSSARQTTNRHSVDASLNLSPINIPSHIARPLSSSQSSSNKANRITSTTSSNVTETSKSSSTASANEHSNDGPPCNLVRRHSSTRQEISRHTAHYHSRQHSAPDSSALPTSSNAFAVHAQVPIFYMAMYSYKPQKEDELELKKSELYTVSEKCLDGWYKGTSLRTVQTGVFPGNYVQVAKSSLLQANTQQAVSASSSSNKNVSSSSSTSKDKVPSSSSKRNKLSANQANNATPSQSKTPISSPPPRPPRPQAASDSDNTSSPWVAKSESSPTLPQPPKMTVALPPNSITSSSITMSSSIPVPVISISSSRQAICSTTSSQSWHGVISSSSRSPTITLMSNATTVTPPNIAINVTPSSSKNTPVKNPKDKKEKEKVSTVLKRLTGVKKKSKSPPPPPTNFSMDNPNFLDSCAPSTPVSHVRTGSCPSESSTPSTSHKKSASIDSDVYSNSAATPRPKQPAPLVRERFRCIVPYPPNSDYELELKIGDIIYVHRKRDDGWYKGTLQRTGVTGHFPGSFVEKF